METDKKLQGFVVGSVPTVIYVPEFISEAEQTQLWDHIYQAPVSKWKTLKNRRLQNWGGVVHEKGLISQDLPPWLTKVTQRIEQEFGIFPAAPNHVLINEYLPDQGIMVHFISSLPSFSTSLKAIVFPNFIILCFLITREWSGFMWISSYDLPTWAHQDGPAYFPAAAIMSLGSPVVMNFTPHLKLSECNGTIESDAGPQNSKTSGIPLDRPANFSLLLMPRSLLIFKDLAYSDYLHGIEDNAVQPYAGAVNLNEAVNDPGANELISSLVRDEKPGSMDAKILQRTTKRVSLTCRLVLKVRKNLIKI